MGHEFPTPRVKNFCNGWSKSIILEIRVVLDVDFRHGAKKSGHMDQPLHNYDQIYSNIFQFFLREVGLLWFATS